MYLTVLAGSDKKASCGIVQVFCDYDDDNEDRYYYNDYYSN